MRVLHLSASANHGGAGRAAKRIWLSQVHSGMNSRFYTLEGAFPKSESGNSSESLAKKFRKQVVPRLESAMIKSLNDDQVGSRTTGLFTMIRGKTINELPVDVVNLHWVMGGMLSIREIGKIKKPIVWTFHDCWPILGTHHYDNGDFYWKHSTPQGRVNDHKSDQVDRLALWLKRTFWDSSIRIVAPSHWMKEQVLQSQLSFKSKTAVIPNPIDTEFWRPIDRDVARHVLGWDRDKYVVLFGAMAATTDMRKGYDLFVQAVDRLCLEEKEIEIFIFGSNSSEEVMQRNNIRFLGHLGDDISLRLAYSAADVFVVTSRQENLPNTAVEASACGTPVVAFNVGGLSDIVLHMETGYLAKPFDVGSLVEGIRWFRARGSKKEYQDVMLNMARTKFGYAEVSSQYKSVYDDLIHQSVDFRI